jgi:hypothetical protein
MICRNLSLNWWTSSVPCRAQSLWCWAVRVRLRATMPEVIGTWVSTTAAAIDLTALAERGTVFPPGILGTPDERLGLGFGVAVKRWM